VAPLHAAAAQHELDGFDDYVRAAVASWGIPGVAVVVVKDDSIVFIKGYGVRETGKPAPVDENTIFQIGSVTKTFTAAAAGLEVGAGRMSFDDPVTKFLPTLMLSDPWITREITLRDLLVHRGGFDNTGLWYGAPFTRADVMQRLKYVPQRVPFRSRFFYSNLGYLIAGEAAAASGGRTWEDLVANGLLLPLGMTRTFTTSAALSRQTNVAVPHRRIPGGVQPIPFRSVEDVAPAGAMASTARDLAQWLRLQLNGGTYNHQRILTESVIGEMQSPQVVMPMEPTPDSKWMASTVGWFVYDWRGHRAVMKDGALDGISAIVSMIPELHVGVAVLTNLEGNALGNSLVLRAFDAYLRAPPVDHAARNLVSFTASAPKPVPPLIEQQAPLPFDRFIGTYSSAIYGPLSVGREASGLVLRRSDNLVADLLPADRGTFRAHWRTGILGDRTVTFTFAADSTAASLRVSGIWNEFVR
jgi:CubicO group peptidase (beta-lactamase class C family)